MKTRIWAISAFVVGTGWGVLIDLIAEPGTPCDAGQVYVVDTGSCVSATDHTTHTGG